MNAVLDALAMWGLMQVLFVWFWARAAAVRELDRKRYMQLNEYLLRVGLQPADDPEIDLWSPDPITYQVPPAGVARA
jgi:hypothetical protein